jgi:hypothetical protein
LLPICHKFPGPLLSLYLLLLLIACSHFSIPAAAFICCLCPEAFKLPPPATTMCPPDPNKSDDASVCCPSAPLPQLCLLPASSACTNCQIAAAPTLEVHLLPIPLQLISATAVALLYCCTRPPFLTVCHLPFHAAACSINLLPSNTTAPLKPAAKPTTTFCNHMTGFLCFLLLPANS